MSQNAAIKARYLGFPRKSVDYLALAVEIRQKAIEEAELTLKEAKRQTKAIYINTRKRARERAYNLAKRKAELEVAKKYLEIDSSYQSTIRQANEDCLSLCLAIAKEVIGEAILSEKDAIANRIENALEKLADSRVHKILVHPDSLSDIKASLEARFPARKFNCLPSASIGPGNTAIETPSGTIELRWEDHFQVIEEKLKQKLHEKVSGADATSWNP